MFNNPKTRHVVYKYTCLKIECRPSEFWIGYTTTTLKQKMTAHAHKSSIDSHSSDVHSERFRNQKILDNIKLLSMSPDRSDLILAETLFAKSESPTLNNQRGTETRIENKYDVAGNLIQKIVT